MVPDHCFELVLAPEAVVRAGVARGVVFCGGCHWSGDGWVRVLLWVVCWWVGGGWELGWTWLR